MTILKIDWARKMPGLEMSFSTESASSCPLDVEKSPIQFDCFVEKHRFYSECPLEIRLARPKLKPNIIQNISSLIATLNIKNELLSTTSTNDIRYGASRI